MVEMTLETDSFV